MEQEQEMSQYNRAELTEALRSIEFHSKEVREGNRKITGKIIAAHSDGAQDCGVPIGGGSDC
jgi:hypothetical protein